MMVDDEAFSARILARRQELADGAAQIPLRIAVLGPNLDDRDNIGTKKRRQIADSLVSDGHDTLFSEHHVLMDDPLLIWIEEERRLLSGNDVDFVVILHTESSIGGLSAGALSEIANFVSVPAIRVKTGVLFPSKHYTPTQSLAANTVQAYTTRMLYTEEDMESCELVAECRRWANTRIKDMSPDLQSEVF